VAGVPDRAMFPSAAVDMAPALSPDGKLVAFASTRSGWEQLWVGHIGDAAPAQATHFQSEGLVLYSAWAPDSRLVAFSYREGAATNIFLYSVTTGALKQVTATRNRDITPAFSADGKYLYYSSNDDGTSRIWRVRTDGSEHPEPMFWEAVTGYLPSSDGKWMYFLEAGQSVSLVRRNLKDGSTEPIFNTAGSPAFPNAIASANGFVYIAVSLNNSSQADVFRISPDTKTARVLTHLKELPPFEVSGFTVSPTGEFLILSQVVRNASSLYFETLN
jgi:Tol biopolymer transport system component